MHSAFILSRLHGSTIEHYVIKFVSDFSSDTPDSSTYESDRHDINVHIVECGVKHYKPNLLNSLIL